MKTVIGPSPVILPTLPLVLGPGGATMLGWRDPFETWRLVLGTVCAIYAAIVTVRSLWRVVASMMKPP